MTLALAVVVKNTKNVVEQICNQMKTIQKKIDAQYPDADVIAQAAEILRHGGLVAFPTETVYGLGANGLDEAACQGIYQAKGRPSDNPLILHISHIDELRPIVRDISKTAQKLIDAFWPGPLTMIFPKADCVPNVVTGGLDTVAVRFPSHPVAMALIYKAGLPIAAPSANTSGKPSPTRAEHVVLDLDGKINMILSGAYSRMGIGVYHCGRFCDTTCDIASGGCDKRNDGTSGRRYFHRPNVVTKTDSRFSAKSPRYEIYPLCPKGRCFFGTRQ